MALPCVGRSWDPIIGRALSGCATKSNLKAVYVSLNIPLATGTLRNRQDTRYWGHVSRLILKFWYCSDGSLCCHVAKILYSLKIPWRYWASFAVLGPLLQDETGPDDARFNAQEQRGRICQTAWIFERRKVWYHLLVKKKHKHWFDAQEQRGRICQTAWIFERRKVRYHLLVKKNTSTDFTHVRTETIQHVDSFSLSGKEP